MKRYWVFIAIILGFSAIAATVPMLFPNILSTSSQHQHPNAQFLTKRDAFTLPERYHGRVVLVHFWATWCGPCVKELPMLSTLQTQYPARALSIVLFAQEGNINGQPPQERVPAFLKRYGAEALESHIDDTGQVGRALKVNGLPTSIIFDHTGKEIVRFNGLVDWANPTKHELFKRLMKAAE